MQHHHKEKLRMPITVLLDYVAHRLDVAQNSTLCRYGITGKQARILFCIIRHKERPLNQKDIERIFAIRGSTITSILGYLENKGLIRRVTDAQDGRSKRLLPTESGMELHRIIIDVTRRYEQLALSDLGPDDIRCLRRALFKIAANVAAVQDSGEAAGEEKEEEDGRSDTL